MFSRPDGALTAKMILGGFRWRFVMTWLVRPRKLDLVKPAKEHGDDGLSRGAAAEEVYGYEDICALNCPSFCSCETFVGSE